MRKSKGLIVLGMVLLMAGCVPVPSLHPWFKEKDLVFEPALEGTWTSKKTVSGNEGQSVLTFQKGEHDTYELTSIEDGVPAKFEVHLFKLGEFLFLSVSPEELPEKMNDVLKAHLLPAHTLSRIWNEGDLLRLEPLNAQWVQRMINTGEIGISHERLGSDGIVLTASADDLQALVIKATQDPEAFHPVYEWRRQK